MHKYNFNFISHECINYQDKETKEEGGRERGRWEGREEGTHTHKPPRDSWDYKVAFILGVRKTNI